MFRTFPCGHCGYWCVHPPGYHAGSMFRTLPPPGGRSYGKCWEQGTFLGGHMQHFSLARPPTALSWTSPTGGRPARRRPGNRCAGRPPCAPLMPPGHRNPHPPPSAAPARLPPVSVALRGACEGERGGVSRCPSPRRSPSPTSTIDIARRITCHRGRCRHIAHGSRRCSPARPGWCDQGASKPHLEGPPAREPSGSRPLMCRPACIRSGHAPASPHALPISVPFGGWHYSPGRSMVLAGEGRHARDGAVSGGQPGVQALDV